MVAYQLVCVGEIVPSRAPCCFPSKEGKLGAKN